MKNSLSYLLAGCLLLTACSAQNDEKPAPPSAAADTAVVSQTTETDQAEIAAQTPPTPPLIEDFQASPQLSLFPRAGAFRPEDDDEKGLQFWRTYLDHLMRTSGPLKTGPEDDGNIAFGFRAIKGLESVGVFAPVAVKPGSSYEVSARISCNLEKDATAGIGILEFDKFLWIGEQYPESLAREHQVGTQPGVSLTGLVEKRIQKFTFTSGPKTEMIHLVFFRDGSQDRNPVVIDDIEIKPKS